jgi:hypothetical protein
MITKMAASARNIIIKLEEYIVDLELETGREYPESKNEERFDEIIGALEDILMGKYENLLRR